MGLLRDLITSNLLFYVCLAVGLCVCLSVSVYVYRCLSVHLSVCVLAMLLLDLDVERTVIYSHCQFE